VLIEPVLFYVGLHFTGFTVSFGLQQRASPTCAVFSADSQQLLTGGYRTIYVWRMGTGQLDFKLTRHQDFISCLRFACNHRFLISSSLDRTGMLRLNVI
jgi:WD40 repeat protein